MKEIKKLYITGLVPEGAPLRFGNCGRNGLGVTISLPETNEEERAGYGSVSFDTQAWGTAPTWEDILAALYWGDDNVGEQLEAAASHAHDSRTAPWRVEVRTGMSGRKDYLVRVRDEVAEKYGTAGKITASLHISCAGKLNRGIPNMGLADWYVLLKTVPSLSWEEIEEAYKDYPPKELRTVSAEWHAPGAEPWEGNSITPEGEKEEDGRREYTLEEIRERVRANYAGEDEEPAEQDTPQSTGKLISTFHNPNIYDPFNLMDR